MSILSASSAFTLNARSQGLFSSHTAFKKPTFNATFNKSSNEFTRLVTSAHPKDLANSHQKAAKICNKSEDPELIMCDPVKKVKLGKDETLCSESMTNKTQQNTVRSSRLTIEEVFNTPFDRKQNRKSSLIEDCFDEGSSLSFISSHSSFDNLDDESLTSRKNSDCVITGAEKMASNTDPQQSLVVKDDIMGRLSYLNQEPMLFNNWENHSVFFGQGNLYQSAAGYLKTLPVDVSNTSGLGCNGPLCMPPLNEYIQFTMQNQQVGMSLSDKVINELVKHSVEDGYDSDSYATRSTSIEQETAEKGASPTYSGNEDLYLERNVQQNNSQKNDKVRKQGRSRATNLKEKKGRSLNLKLDLNPKQIKVQRRLNRLQLLRYQQGTVEEEHEYLKQFGISDLLSRGNSTIQESDELAASNNEDDDYVEDHFDPEYAKATVPELGEENPRKKRVRLMPAWNPENLEEEKFEDYIKQLGELLESPVNDIEAATKLLKNHDMNISQALEAVKENVVFYSEVFRLKVKRLRRRGA